MDLRPPSPAEEQITREVWGWIEQVRRVLEMTGHALERMELKEPATPAERQLVKKLPGLIRQRLAGVPTPEMIQTWLRVLSRPAAPAPPQPRSRHK
ncbi:MAG TPA: hypothetical protein VN541_15430 [Tepidisphaeraceae bacterium]|nr:hypothetical protein [Tepidisphaeraceae bacterium]